MASQSIVFKVMDFEPAVERALDVIAAAIEEDDATESPLSPGIRARSYLDCLWLVLRESDLTTISSCTALTVHRLEVEEGDLKKSLDTAARRGRTVTWMEEELATIQAEIRRLRGSREAVQRAVAKLAEEAAAVKPKSRRKK